MYPNNKNIFKIEENNNFQKRERESSVDVVIKNIKNLLITKQLVPGDKIPNEVDFSEAMGFSRGTIREAMKILAAFKIIDIRRGDGTYVSTSVNKTLFDPLLFSLITSNSDIRELAELRELFELGLAKLIIKNAEKNDMDIIYKVCSEMKSCIDNNEKNSEILLKCDLDFHSALARSTKNILIIKIYDFIMDFLAPQIKHTLENRGSAKRTLKLHTNIYEALYSKDLKKAIKSIKLSIKAWVFFTTKKSTKI